MKPHKHADLIKAWADGIEIEYRGKGSDDWFPLFAGWSWDNSLVAEYRIKPEPKPDDSWLYVAHNREVSLFKISTHSTPNLKLTFDGETGELKLAEVLK